MPESIDARQSEFSIRGGAPSAYERLKLPLWASDSQRIFSACRAQIDELRRGGDEVHPQQLQQRIAELLRARDILTSPGARADYDDQLRAELIERDAAVTADLPTPSSERREPRMSAASVETRILPEARATAATLQLSPDAVVQRQPPGETNPTEPTQPMSAELDTGCSDRGTPQRRSVLSALRFIVAVAVTAFAINLAFFRPKLTWVGSNSDADKSTQTQTQPPLPDNPATTDVARSAIAPKDESTVVAPESSVVDPAPLAKVTPHIVAKPQVKDAEAVNVEQPAEVVAATIAPADKQPETTLAVAPDKPAAPAMPLNNFKRPLPETLNPDERRQYAKQIRDMLYEGFSSGKEAFQRSTTLYEQTASLSTDDPRLHFGYGLVLWKRLKHAEAVEKFEQAAEIDSAYWPVQQTFILLKLRRSEYDDGFDLVADMVNRLQKRQAGTITDEDRHAAYWLGRLMSYLQQPENQMNAPPARLQIVQALIERQLHDELLDAFRAGELRLNDEFAALVALSQQNVKQELARAAERSSERMKSLQKKLELQKDRQENVDRTAREWQEWIDKQTSAADKRLKDLSAQFSRVDAQARAYRAAIRKLDRDYANLPQIITELMLQEKDRVPIMRIEHPNPFKQYYGLQPVPIDSYSATRVHYEAQYNRLDAEAANIRRRAVEVVNLRAQAVLRYQQATGVLLDKSDSLRNWEKILEKQKASIEQGQDSPDASHKAKLMQRKARALETYVAFDPDAERQRIVDSLPEE